MPLTCPNPFWKLAVLLEETIWSTRTHWRFPFLSYPAGSDQAEHAWLAAETKHRIALDDFVRQWIATRKIPPMTDEQMFWFQKRFVAAYEFLYQFAPEGQPSIFTFPDVPTEDLLRWMLIDWWVAVGAYEAMFSIVEPDYGTRHTQN
jgi:hypothetical protein